MARLKDVITDDNYFEYLIPIGSSAVEYIVRALQEVYTAKFIVKMKPNFLMDNLLTISMFFDTKRNRLYLSYKLDKDHIIAVRASDIELYNRIYSYTHTQLIDDYSIGVSFIGDQVDKPENTHFREYGNDMNDLYLRNSTQFMWTIETKPNGNKYTYFIENRDILEDDLRKRLIKDSWDISTIIEDGVEKEIKTRKTPKDIMPEYNEKVFEINKKYDLSKVDGPASTAVIYGDYDGAFEEYQSVYNEYFERTPEKVPEWKAFTVFVSVEHNFDQEKIAYEQHPYGKFINPEETEHYIAKWAHDHGKYVPPEILDKWGIG